MIYSELQTALTGFGHRSDLASLYPTFVSLAQARINVQLRTADQLTRVTLTDTDRVTPGEGRYNLPSNYVQIVELTGLSNGQRYALEAFPLSDLYSINSTGLAARFAIYDAILEFRAVPETGTSYELTYYKKEGALSAAGDTTGLLTNHPALYVDGALIELHKYTQDLELSSDAAERFNNYRDGLNSAANRQRGRMASSGPYNFRPSLRGSM